MRLCLSSLNSQSWPTVYHNGLATICPDFGFLMGKRRATIRCFSGLLATYDPPHGTRASPFTTPKHCSSPAGPPIVNHSSKPKRRATPAFPTSPSSGWTPLSRGSDGAFRTAPASRQTIDPQRFVTNRAFPHALPPSEASVLSLRPCRLVFSRCRSSERKNKPTPAEGKKHELEEVNQKTKEAVDFLVAALESGHSEVLTAYLGAMAKFRNYSFGNIMLIARQKPDATNVAGLRTWNSLGRFVRRGEKGIFILAPMVGNKHRKNENAEPNEDAKEIQPTLYGFRAVYVFDISQTDGKDLPTLTEVQGDVSGYRERLVKFVEAQGITLNYSDKIGPAKGLSYGGKITLLSGMQPAEEFSTLAHEIGHELLHRGERRALTTKQVRETEAEAVAFEEY